MALPSSLLALLSILTIGCTLSFVLGLYRHSTSRGFDSMLENLLQRNFPNRPWQPRCVNQSGASLELDHFLTASSQQIKDEIFIQPALFAHPNPKHVALVSSDEMHISGLVAQILKHKSVEKLWIIGNHESYVTNLRQSMSYTCSSMSYIMYSSYLHSSSQHYSQKVFEPDVVLPNSEECSIQNVDVLFVDNYSDSVHRGQGSPEFWFDRLSSDHGIFATHLDNNNPTNGYLGNNNPVNWDAYFSQASSLPTLGFERVVDYYSGVVDGQGKKMMSKVPSYLVAFKSAETRAHWHQNEAHWKLEFHKRIIVTPPDPPFLFFDGSFMVSIEFPSKTMQDEYCKRNPNSKGCDGLDPEIPDIPLDQLKVQKSQMGEHSGRGVFAPMEIDTISYIGLEISSRTVQVPWQSYQLLHCFYCGNEIYENDKGDVLYSYIDGYGIMHEPWGKPEYYVDSGILTFTNHGCNGTFNVGVLSDYHESSSSILKDHTNIPPEYLEPLLGYYPIRVVFRSVVKNHGIIAAGEELLDNYLAFGGKTNFADMQKELQNDCSGGVGTIEEYESWDH